MLSWIKGMHVSVVPPLPALGWTAIAILTGPVSWLLAIVLLLITDTAKYLVFLYLAWMYVDKRSCVNNRRRWNWLRRLSWWKRHRDYFPIKLKKACDLPADRNYLFAVYPHGIFSFGAMTSFTTDALDFDHKFPGLQLFFCTLNIVFRLPILREFALGQGFSSVSEESINNILGTSEKGRVAVVVVGGAAEAALSNPNAYRVLLNRRKGFCKVALKNGCDLVPVYSFRESDLYELYEPEEGSLLHKIQLGFKRWTGVFPVIFCGAGLLPRRVPLTVTVGEPIPVEKVSEPTQEQVEELHGKFRDGLLNLFNENKGRFLQNADAELMIC